ncbi:MAG: PHP domain-containing protein [Pseudomonadota bacterium]
MLATFRADLHLHTCLSPCGDLDMSPRAVVETALAAGLDIIAVCDHNTAENVAAACRAADRSGGRPRVMPGMEICTQEEVHVLALFETLDQALRMQSLVYRHLPPKTNRPDIFGEHVVANEDDEVEGFNDRLLISAISLGLNAVIEAIHRLDGLAIPSHIDREVFGLIGQLGFVPPGLEADAYELSWKGDSEELLSNFSSLAERPFLRSSDAHFPTDIGRGWTEFILEKPVFPEIRLALRGTQGRKINRIG